MATKGQAPAAGRCPHCPFSRHTNQPEPTLAFEQLDLRVLQCSGTALYFSCKAFVQVQSSCDHCKYCKMSASCRLVSPELKTSGNVVIALGVIPLKR